MWHIVYDKCCESWRRWPVLAGKVPQVTLHIFWFDLDTLFVLGVETQFFKYPLVFATFVIKKKSS